MRNELGIKLAELVAEYECADGTMCVRSFGWFNMTDTRKAYACKVCFEEIVSMISRAGRCGFVYVVIDGIKDGNHEVMSKVIH